MNTVSLQDNVLSRKQACEFLGVCLTTLSRMNIPRVKVRKRVLYQQSVLLEWLKKNTRSKETQK